MRNERYFQPPMVRLTYLTARGFGRTGSRTGGLRDPVEVDIPTNAVLFRLYHDPARKYGEWWWTPQEMKLVINHFGRGGAAFSEGRTTGNGILHGVLAVRHDWGASSTKHLERFVIVRLREPVRAYYGDGDDAPGSADVQKAARIIDAAGNQRFVRQVFLPRCWEYAGVFEYLGSHMTDVALIGAVETHRRLALPFEN